MKQAVGNRIPIRRSVVKLVSEVVQDKISIQAAINRMGAQGGDRAWLFETLSGYFRWKQTIDYWIDRALKKGKISNWTRRAIGIAIYQIIDQNIEPALISNETVQMVKNKQGSKPASFVNAILRDAVTQRKAIEANGPQFTSWVRKAFVKNHGEAWTAKYESQLKDRPRSWLRADEAISLEGWVKPIESMNAYCGGDIGQAVQSSEFEDGKIYVQNISSQKAIKWVSGLLRSENASEQVLDLCAAPGGKSTGLVREGFTVVASDISEQRLARLNENKKRLKITDEELKVLPFSDIQFSNYSAIWVDAPCSSLGLLSHHPEIQWNRSEADLAEMVRIQKTLLQEVWAGMKSGAMLIYSVCSPLKNEGPNLFRESLEVDPNETLTVDPFEYDSANGFWAGAVKKTTV